MFMDSAAAAVLSSNDLEPGVHLAGPLHQVQRRALWVGRHFRDRPNEILTSDRDGR